MCPPEGCAPLAKFVWVDKTALKSLAEVEIYLNIASVGKVLSDYIFTSIVV